MTPGGKRMLGLASLVCATFAAAMAPSLWLFALLATASFLAVWFLERKLGIAERLEAVLAEPPI